jgi:ankyrin repeat protein
MKTLMNLLELKVNPNAYHSQGNTPLMAFIHHDLSETLARRLLKEVLQLLIDSGACVHRRNRRDETALHIAMKLGRPFAVEVLLKNHANIHARNRRGVGVLLTAQRAALKAKSGAGLYARIVICMRIALENRPPCVLTPSAKQEWDQ